MIIISLKEVKKTMMFIYKVSDSGDKKNLLKQ